MYADITLPNDPALARRVVKIQVEMAVTHAYLVSEKQYAVGKPTLRKSVQVVIASPEQVQEHRRVLILGVLGSAILLTLSELWMLLVDRRLRRFPQPEVDLVDVGD